ncbi:ribonuclease P protein subunit p25-like protein [Eriocheir sinensis]|uniref:ribonuclease P protein subunit p25-like protein n=1 Tax=Eriocheir sinensis TaxID=95602 RepID=UPI0021C8ADFC|nr:ribonuclease P protein subunit p25-like protein [Eriocheir sinensis]
MWRGRWRWRGRRRRRRLRVSPGWRLGDSGRVVVAGSGAAAGRVVACVEAVKRRHRHGLHQLTALGYRRVDEYWEGKTEGLDTLRVTREVPGLMVLLSKATIDPSLPGPQKHEF